MTTMREAVRQYFEDNGFGADGGYAAAWVDFKLGPLPFPLPNTDARRKAVKFHDLNHVLTGYRTDLRGEFEISAWEIGAGCRDFWAAWALNLSGMVGGLFTSPLRTWRAFVAGRRSTAAYALDYEQAMDTEVEVVREKLGVTTAAGAKASDVLLFPLALGAGLVIGTLGLMVLLSPVTLALWWKGRRLQRAAA
jgi:hypothetical protein